MKQILGFTTEDSHINNDGVVVQPEDYTESDIVWDQFRMTWESTYSDGTVVNLPVDEARRGEPVGFGEREEFVLKAIQMRLSESIP